MRSGTARTARMMAVALIGTAWGCGSEEVFSLGREQHDIREVARARIAPGDQGLFQAVVVGDLDGDGIADAMVSASSRDPNAGPSDPYAAPTYVLYGGNLTGEIDLAGLPSLRSRPLESTGGGGTIFPLGDVDGDGLADVLIRYEPACGLGGQAPSEEARYGGLYLMYGSATRLAGAAELGDAAVFLRSSRPCELPVNHVERLGDLDGDGKDDFAISVGPSLFVYYGRGERWSGTIDLQAFEAAPDAELRIPWLSIIPGDFVAAGDVDGDGYDDFFLDGKESYVGLVRGGPARLTGTHLIDEVVATRFVGKSICLWHAMVPLGDLDGDGLDDVAIWTCPPVPITRSTFAYQVYYGRAAGFPAEVDTSEADMTVSGSSVRAQVFTGIPVASGDLDGDGARDLVLSDPDAADENGGVYVLPGRAGRRSGNVDLGDTATVYLGGRRQVPCSPVSNPPCIEHDLVGSVASVGDLTGDGRADLLVTAPTSSFTPATLGVHGSSFSAVYLVSPHASKP